MTFDLGVWKSSPGLTSSKASFVYQDLCLGQRGPQVLPGSKEVRAFYDELTATWPEVTSRASKYKVSTEDTPWAGPLLLAEDYVLLSCEWQHAEIVLALVTALAGKHGLSVFEPQSEELYLPSTTATDGE